VAMTKADIVEALYEKVGFSKKEAADLVEMVFNALKDSLAKGDKVKISSFVKSVLAWDEIHKQANKLKFQREEFLRFVHPKFYVLKLILL
jgi:uncharacterized protein (DUF2267 family)